MLQNLAATQVLSSTASVTLIDDNHIEIFSWILFIVRQITACIGQPVVGGKDDITRSIDLSHATTDRIAKRLEFFGKRLFQQIATISQEEDIADLSPLLELPQQLEGHLRLTGARCHDEQETRLAKSTTRLQSSS